MVLFIRLLYLLPDTIAINLVPTPDFDKIGSTRAGLGAGGGGKKQGKIQCWESNFNMFWSIFAKVGRHIFENL